MTRERFRDDHVVMFADVIPDLAIGRCVELELCDVSTVRKLDRELADEGTGSGRTRASRWRRKATLTHRRELDRSPNVPIGEFREVVHDLVARQIPPVRPLQNPCPWLYVGRPNWSLLDTITPP